MRKTRHTRAPAGLVLVLLAAVGLAGCTDADEPAPAPTLDTPSGITAPVRAEDGRDLKKALRADDEVPAPDWAVGDWFGLHGYFGSQDTAGRHFEVVVVAEDAEQYELATSDADVAKDAAVFGNPILGAINKADLSMASSEGTWQWLRFPFTDGDTWEGSMPNIAWDVLPDGQIPLTMTAAYSPVYKTPDGDFPGHTITGTTATGQVLLSLDYLPALGWFSNLIIYDIDPEDDPVEIRVSSMGHGSGWTGTYYVDTAVQLVYNVDGSGLDAPPPDGQPVLQPSPHVAFTVPQGATYLYGFVYGGSVFGVRGIVLVPPEGDARHWEHVGADSWIFEWIDEPAVAGDWELYTVGAGAFSWSEVWLNAITENTATL